MIVINNAAITDIENGMLKDSLEEPTHFSKLIEINLMGVIYGKKNSIIIPETIR